MKLFVLSFVDRQEGLVVNILHAIHLRQSAIAANSSAQIRRQIIPRSILLIVTTKTFPPRPQFDAKILASKIDPYH